jgi:thioredoxin-dependent peroxiredoxin
MTLKVGVQAPDFEAVDTDGQHFSLAELCLKGPVILMFYPKAFTPL